MLANNPSQPADTQQKAPQPAILDIDHILSLQELYRLDDHAFLAAAYRIFLGRDASGEEVRAQLGLLDSGISKSAVAASLRYSPEGRSRPQRFHLRKAWLTWLPTRIPVLGRFFETLIALAGGAALKRQVLIHQRQLQLQNELRENALMELNTTLKNLHDSTKLDFAALRNDYQQVQQQLGRMTDSSVSNGAEADPMDDGFYLAFEDHFRGSGSVIRDRLAVYLPIIRERLPTSLIGAPMVDIGCGRGEWLSLLREQGYQSTGIDLNSRNIETCMARGLDARLGDGIAWLRQQDSHSLALIASFHVIEHLTLGQLNTLLVEAIRTLQPGGLLILETPNPENLITAANRFYTDPTHRNPLPPELTEFLLKYKGFHQVEVHRLHPVDRALQLAEESELTQRWNSLFYGPQDYAVIGCKPVS